MKKQPTLAIFCVVFSFVIGFFLWLESKPQWIERLYSIRLYPKIFAVRQAYFDLFPFSVGDLIYLLLFLWLINQLKNLFRSSLRQGLYNLFAGSVILFLWFKISWGLNYNRLPLHTKMSGTKTYSEEDLIQMTTFFANTSNLLYHKINPTDSTAVKINDTPHELIQRIVKDPVFDDQNRKVKISLFSLPLLYMGFTGYLNPLTLEAQVNSYIPSLSLPLTITHEMAHQDGYAAEDEANYIGFVQLYNHSDSDLQFAANLFGYRYCMAELYKINPKNALSIRQSLHPGVQKNITEIRNFWRAHKNPFQPLFKQSYDAYLKANRQSKGIQSYNGVVALMIQDFKLNNNFRQ